MPFYRITWFMVYTLFGLHVMHTYSLETFGSSIPASPLGYDRDEAGLICGIQPPLCTRSRYRKIDGSCNNLQRPLWGVPQTPYGRLLPHNYADGQYAWPLAQSRDQLPNPRTISLHLFPDKNIVDPVWTLIGQQWGQVIAHDMSLTDTRTLIKPTTCCTEDGLLAPDVASNDQCAPILVPAEDIVHIKSGRQCQNFIRTTTTMHRGCRPPRSPAKPLTVVTAYMDNSLVYGNSAEQAAPLRAFVGGRMLTEVHQGREFPPSQPNITKVCGSVCSINEPCYLAGDTRVNQNPHLTLLQIMLIRDHNGIAKELALLNPHWNDEKLFQEARRIAIAKIQHINYYEYLPILLGVENMIKTRLIYPGATGYINDYDHNVDPTVLDEHATAAFRHFHSLIRGHLHFVSEKRQSSGSIRLSDWFNRPGILERGDSFDKLARGLVTQPQDFSDQSVTEEVTQFLFKGNNTFGEDLRARDIQRSRDHGMGSYVAYRKWCGLPVPLTFYNMTDFISEENVAILQQLYENPLDVDLVVAGSLERNVPGAQAGPTFLCILVEQFYRTRVGDRFFYENGQDRSIAFTPGQLREIRKSNIARMMCDNSDNIKLMQPRAFELINHKNQLVPCWSLPAPDLRLWKDVNGFESPDTPL